MLSSRSLVVPPAAENPPGLPPAASTRWHGTMIQNGFIRGVRLRSRHVHFLVPDELTFVTRRIESKILSNRLRNDHGACEPSRGCRGRTTSFGEIVAVGSSDAFDHPKAAEPA